MTPGRRRGQTMPWPRILRVGHSKKNYGGSARFTVSDADLDGVEFVTVYKRDRGYWIQTERKEPS